LTVEGKKVSIKNYLNFFIKNIKFLIFIIIFALTSVISNINSPEINSLFNRGIALEYSVVSLNANELNEIRDKVKSLDYKYFYVDMGSIEEDAYDFSNNEISKILYVELPTVLDEKDKERINQISDFIFKKDKSASLIDIKMLGNIYSRSFASFSYFLQILSYSFFIWFFVLIVFFNAFKTGLFTEYKNNILNFFKKQAQDLKAFFEKVKINGFGYFIKRLLFDEEDCDDCRQQSLHNVLKHCISDLSAWQR